MKMRVFPWGKTRILKGERLLSIHTGHRQRVKAEFLSRGIEGWPDHRVLELILFYAIPQGDVNPLAHELIERFGSLAKVLDASSDELRKVPGLGEHSIALLQLLPAVGGRYVSQRSGPGRLVHTSEDAAKLLAPHFYGAANEMVYVLCLDSKGKELGVRKVSEGNISNSDVNIRRIAEICMALNASYFFMAHNHTSHLAFPSAEDWQCTDVVKCALAPLGVSMVDHLIFVEGDVVSLRETERSGGRKVLRLVGPEAW